MHAIVAGTPPHGPVVTWCLTDAFGWVSNWHHMLPISFLCVNNYLWHYDTTHGWYSNYNNQSYVFGLFVPQYQDGYMATTTINSQQQTYQSPILQNMGHTPTNLQASLVHECTHTTPSKQSSMPTYSTTKESNTIYHVSRGNLLSYVGLMGSNANPNKNKHDIRWGLLWYDNNGW
jgi:hypothetical protein